VKERGAAHALDVHERAQLVHEEHAGQCGDVRGVAVAVPVVRVVLGGVRGLGIGALPHRRGLLRERVLV